LISTRLQLRLFPKIICKPTFELGTYPTSKAWGVTIRENFWKISEYFTIPTILFPSSNDDDLGIVGIVKKIKKKKNTLLLTPHASEKWIRGKTPFYILLSYFWKLIKLGYSFEPWSFYD
jgi:hypothetical protein